MEICGVCENAYLNFGIYSRNLSFSRVKAMSSDIEIDLILPGISDPECEEEMRKPEGHVLEIDTMKICDFSLDHDVPSESNYNDGRMLLDESMQNSMKK